MTYEGLRAALPPHIEMRSSNKGRNIDEAGYPWQAMIWFRWPDSTNVPGSMRSSQGFYGHNVDDCAELAAPFARKMGWLK